MNNDLLERLLAFEQEYNSSDIEIKESGNMPSHYQEDVNMYLLDKAAKLIGDLIIGKVVTTGSYESVMRLLEETFEAGFSAGFHTEENPADHVKDWEEYKKTLDI